MGTMNKMRENTGVVLWILVIAFGGLWVLQDSGMFDALGGGTGDDLIVVDGDPISYEEYNRALEQQIEAYQQQTGEQMPPQRLELEEERVFNALVENKLREHEMDRLGITVTDEEIYEMVLGEEPHPVIKVYFGDGQGGVDRALLQSFITDPEAKEQWLQLEEFLRAERRRQKLENLIGTTVRVSEAEILDEYRRRNRSADAEVVYLRYADIPNDSVEVSESDLRAYYNAHKEDFKRERTYTIKLASVSKLPSSEDSTAILEDLLRLKESFATAEDDSLFLARYGSERPYSDAFFGAADLDGPVAEAIFPDPEVGKVVGPVFAGNEVHLVKVLEVREAEEPVVRARHILFRAPEGDEAARTRARERAQQVKSRIESGEDFVALAREVSEDPGSAVRGGDLGWFGRGRMVEPFEEAAFDASPGEIVGPIETQYGVHLIEVTDRAEREVRLADYAQRIRPSSSTLTEAEDLMEDLRYYSEESGNFEEEASRLQLELQEMTVEQDQTFLPGIGNSRSLMRFLEDAEEGDVSEVIELNDQFIVAFVEAVQPEGYRPLDEVQGELEPRVLLEKKKNIQRERLQRALEEHGFDGLEEGLPRAQKRIARDVSLERPIAPGLGRDLKFAGTVLGLAEGEISPVVEGENAVFVAKVIAVDEPAPITEEERSKIRDELLRTKRAQIQQEWVTSLREKADVEDNRRRYLR